jgi:hypothetical protein
MLERIRTLFGRMKNKTTIVVVGSVWTCTKCRLVFLTKSEGDKHDCKERI